MQFVIDEDKAPEAPTKLDMPDDIGPADTIEITFVPEDDAPTITVEDLEVTFCKHPSKITFCHVDTILYQLKFPLIFSMSYSKLTLC